MRILSQFIIIVIMLLGTGGTTYSMELIDHIVQSNMKRLGLKDEGRAFHNWFEFSDMVALAESNREERAVNIPQKGKKQTTAKGAYQLTDDSLTTALNRMKRYTNGKDLKWAKELREGKKDVDDIGIERQTALFTANLMESEGSDKDVVNILNTGNGEAMWELYAKSHHTQPDEATVKNWDDKFSTKFRMTKMSPIKSPVNVDEEVNRIREAYRNDTTAY